MGIFFMGAMYCAQSINTLGTKSTEIHGFGLVRRCTVSHFLQSNIFLSSYIFFVAKIPIFLTELQLNSQLLA